MRSSSTKMTTRIAVVLSAAALALTAACADPPSSEGGGDSTIRFANMPSALAGGVYIGAEQGYFSEVGLEVENKVFSEGIGAIDAVLGGQSDLAIATPLAAVTRLQSGRLAVLGSVTVTEPGWHKFAVSTSIEGPEGLADATIGYVAGTAEQWVAETYLEIIDLSPDELDMVSFAAQFDMVSALQTGDIDAAWIWGEGVTQIESDPDLEIWFDDSVVSPGTNALIVSTTEYAEQNQDTLAAFFTGVDEGNQFLTDNPGEAAQMIADAVGCDVQAIERQVEANTFEARMNADDIALYQSFADWATRSGTVQIAGEATDYLQLDALAQALPDRVDQ